MLKKAQELKQRGETVASACSDFNLDDAISNMERLLSPNPGSVQDWLEQRGST